MQDAAHGLLQALRALYVAALGRCCARRQSPMAHLREAGAAPPVAAPPAPHVAAWPTLLDVIGFVALNGYAREADACAGLCRETWRCMSPGLSAADADRVRRDHPLWQATIDLRHGREKKTRLSMAALNGHLARVRKLCDWRADVESADTGGRTPLWHASSQGHLGVVRELLTRGASTEAANNSGLRSLYVASLRGHLDVVHELLSRGANIEAETKGGATSLYAATLGRHDSVAGALLAAGADPNFAATEGQTPLIVAAAYGRARVVAALVAHGAVVGAVTRNGTTARTAAGLHAPGQRDAVLVALGVGGAAPRVVA